MIVAHKHSVKWVARAIHPVERQIKYSYIIAGTDMGFSGEAVGLEPPWS
jgi:hypothetical protein